MSKAGKKPLSASRMVPDFGLWVHVSKTIEPVRPDLARELEKFSPDIAPAVQPKAQFAKSTKALKQTTAQPKKPQSFQFTGLDRRQQQRLLRGRVELDGRIDLHGESLASGRLKLLQFLTLKASQGCKTVLVITGKGSSPYTRHTLHGRGYHNSESRSGQLRNALPDWLYETEFRSLVSGFQPAHPKHGGGGAVYVKLRNLSKQNRPE